MKKSIFELLLFMVFSILPAFGQNEAADMQKLQTDKPKKNFALFNSDKILEVSLKFDLTTYLKKDFKKPLDAVLTILTSKTDTLKRDVKLMNSGTFRSQYCNYPPLEIHFKKSVHAYPDSSKIKKLKLITRCESENQFDEYVLREYLVYKLFNVLTDTSFRVRLLRVSYIDSRKNKKPIVQYGFFIEPKEILAARTNSNVVKAMRLTQNDIVPEVMDRLAIFNYMVGNYDWSVAGQHNVDVILPSKFDVSRLGLGIPFDFDLTGIVNAPYAIPSAATGIKSIRERIFLGICRDKETFQNVLENFLNRKKEMYMVINEFPYLSQQSKKDITNFLDEFFDQIKTPGSREKLADYFMKNCKK